MTDCELSLHYEYLFPLKKSRKILKLTFLALFEYFCNNLKSYGNIRSISISLKMHGAESNDNKYFSSS